eukprot:1002480-Prymnesium_polylepis.1
MASALLAACSQFEGRAFGDAMAAAASALTARELATLLQNSFVGAIKECTKEVLQQHVQRKAERPPAGPKSEPNYKDMCAALDEEAVDGTLAASFEALLRVMSAHHAMLAWTLQAEAGEHGA